MKRTKIAAITTQLLGTSITLCGWIKTLRDQKEFSFIEITDGSTLSGIQVIVANHLPDYDKIIKNLSTGASLQITGTLVESPGHKQKWEVQAQSVKILGTCPTDYPLQKKRHSFEFLRTIAHLRPRTNTQGAVLRVRNALAFATHLFFQQRKFLYIQTPIITASDCEGAGEQFLVTTLDLQNLPKKEDKSVDFSKDFFQKPAYLTVSGQLNAETLACALSDVYTFGPTFRAENSNTSRHLAEFWMIEPELAFADLQDDMECAESYLQFVIDYILKNCLEDLEFFDAFIEKGLIARLQHINQAPFARLTYTEAVAILEKSNKSFEFPYSWGSDLQSEHERYLAEEYCKRPVILSDYPKEIKAFYMRMNDDQKTVAAMDILVPKIGELVGGSQREERIDLLKAKIQACGLNPEDYWWYLQLREYGSVPHAGFGAGFERLVQFATGMENIRDVIPFPRYPGHAEF
ncbi:MAG: asparagine--tRNA ligase [Rhabdochlamydiaceae bacterium]|nr:asparagine--tRNA ligase [Rhabdochlamydiaceae bacterium]